MHRMVGLLVFWLMVAIVGFTLPTLFWLGMLGLALFVATGLLGAIKAESQ